MGQAAVVKLSFVGGARRAKASRKEREKRRRVSQAEIVQHWMEMQTHGRRDHSRFEFNPCFMRKVDIRQGVVLKNIGRSHDEPRRYKVVRIKTHIKQLKLYKEVPRVMTIHDEIRLAALDGGEVRHVTFGQLSYSATWWIDA